MAQHPPLASPSDPDKDIWSYLELLQVSPFAFDDHLVVILQVPLLEKSLIMNLYSLPILRPVLKKTFQNYL